MFPTGGTPTPNGVVPIIGRIPVINTQVPTVPRAQVPVSPTVAKVEVPMFGVPTPFMQMVPQPVPVARSPTVAIPRPQIIPVTAAPTPVARSPIIAMPKPLVTPVAMPTPVARSPIIAMPKPLITPVAIPKPLITPVAIPKPLITPVAIPKPLITPFAMPKPLITPFAMPKPLITPFAMPKPLVTPVTMPQPLVVTPVRSPIVAMPRPGITPNVVRPQLFTPINGTGTQIPLMPQPRAGPTPFPVFLPTPAAKVKIQPVIQNVMIKDEVVLRPWQVEWATKARDVLLRTHGYIDTSRMRSGKSYIAMWLAKLFGFRILLVCPVGAMPDWQKACYEYNVELVDIISYQSLRGVKGHTLNHAWLSRIDTVTQGGMKHLNFVTTQTYRQLIDEGILLICDEVQNIKNNSAQYKACNALIRPIIDGGGRSRFGLLSGTLFDKEEHAINLLRLIGYIRAEKMYHIHAGTRELVPEGIQELIDACRFIDANTTNAVLAEIPMSKKTMAHLTYTLYIRVIKASISGAMSPPENIGVDFDVKNGFYNITGNNAAILAQGVQDLARAARFEAGAGTVDIRGEKLGAVTTALTVIESAKTYDMARIGTEILTNDENAKVIFCVNYTQSITDIANLMVMYRPLILNGKIPGKKRGAIVDAFNNDPQYRVLIMNLDVGGVGISLFDTRGDSPRHMLMSPGYKLLSHTQAAARIYGPDARSTAYVRMFYGKGAGEIETKILDALARKSQVLKGTLEENVAQRLILPGNYPSIMEE